MSLDLSRLQRADRTIVVGAFGLLVSLFLFKWYGVSSTASVEGLRFSASANGWHTFTNSRWLWLATVVVAAALVWVRLEGRELRLPLQLQPGEIVAALGGLSAVFILYRVINHPAGGASGTVGGVHYTASAGIKIGIWLALAAAATITYGGYLAMGDAKSKGPAGSEQGKDTSSAFSGLLSAKRPLATDAPPDEPPSGGA